MNRSLSHLQCEKTFERKARPLGLEDYIPKLDELHIKTIGAMASSCSWNPESTTDELVKEKILMKVLTWDGSGDEPRMTTNVKQLLWDCVQEQMMDTRSRYDPRFKDTPPTMGIYTRRDRREAFKAPLRTLIPEVDDDEWDTGHEIEDVLLSRLDDNKFGEHLGPDFFPTLKQEQKHKEKNRKKSKVAAAGNLWKLISGEEVEEEEILQVDIAAYHLVDMAFKRRGMLFHTTGIMSFQKHDEWRRRIWRSKDKEAVWSNESAPGIQEMLRADAKI